MKTNVSILLLFCCLFLTSCNEHPAANEEVVYPVNIETTVFQYPGHCINYPDLQLNADLIAVNSQEEMELWLLKYEEEYPAIDFGKYTLLLLFTKTEYADYQLVQTAEDSYQMDITFEIASAIQLPGAKSRCATLLLAPKMQEQPEFNLKFKEIEDGSDKEDYPKNIKITALHYFDCINFPSLSPPLGVCIPVVSHIINSRAELDLLTRSCFEDMYPSVDFDKHTLILVFAKTDFSIAYQLVQTAENTYRMDIEFELPYHIPDLTKNELFYGYYWRATVILAPKIQEKPEFKFMFKKTEGGGYGNGFPKSVETVDFQIDRKCLDIDPPDVFRSELYFHLRNSHESMGERWLSEGCKEEYPSIDFDRYSLLIVNPFGNRCGTCQLLQVSDDSYRVDIIIDLQGEKPLPTAILAPKIENVKANVIVYQILSSL